MEKKIGLCCDHAGYEMKEYIKTLLNDRGFEVEDFGTNSNDSVDYPDFAHPMAKAVNDSLLDRGISLCGSGNGISMVLNKYPKVRAALCWTAEISHLAREHNDANVLSIPARFISKEEAKNILDEFLNTEFAGGRHQARVDKIAIK